MFKYDPKIINELVDHLSVTELMNHTKEISKWERLSGTEEEFQAFKYIESFLNNLSIETMIYSTNTFISLPIEGNVAFEGYGFSANPPAMSSSTDKEGIMAIAEYIDATEIGAEINLEGKIAVLDGMPMPSILETLNRLNCVGAIFIQSKELVSEGILSPVWGSPSIVNKHLMPNLPVVSINNKDGEILKKYLLDQPDKPIKVYTKMDNRWRKIPILIAEIKSNCDTDDFVLFSGHVDSWYQGAMDNASANATMLEIARIISLKSEYMKRNLRIAFWSGHSHGRYAGSAWYADECWQDLYDNCIVHINIDSVGAINSNILTQAHVMAETRHLAKKYIKEFSGQEFEGIRVGRAGDQSFWGHGIPSLFLTLSEQPPIESDSGAFAKIVGGSSKTSGLGWWWHTPADTFDKIDPDNLLRDAKIYIACISRFCCDEILPIDLRLTIDEITEQLIYWQSEAGNRFSLHKLIDQMNNLKKKIGTIYDIIPNENYQEFNVLIKNISRVLVPINYVRGDKFQQDPAINLPPVPSFALLKGLNDLNDESIINEIIVEAKRIKNKINFSLNELNKTLDIILNDLEIYK